MRRNKVLSIVVTSHNQAESIGNMLRHLANVAPSCAGRFELIVVDDASDQEQVKKTRESVSDFIFDTCVSAYFIQNDAWMNAGGSRNHGAECSSGDWLWFVDGDDLPLVCCFPRLLDFLELTDADCVLLRHLQEEPDGNFVLWNPKPQPSYLDGVEWRVAPWSKIVRRDCFVKFRKHVMLEDAAWWYFQCDRIGKFASIDDVCCYQYKRIVDGNTMQSLDALLANTSAELSDMLRSPEKFGVRRPDLLESRLVQIADIVRCWRTAKHVELRDHVWNVLTGGVQKSTGNKFHSLTSFVLP